MNTTKHKFFCLLCWIYQLQVYIAAIKHTHMATTTHTPNYSKMTSGQLQDEAHEIYKAILAKLDGPQWLEISNMVIKYGSARYYQGAHLVQERKK